MNNIVPPPQSAPQPRAGKSPGTSAGKSQHVLLRLFVTGRTPNALRARAAVDALVKSHADTSADTRIDVEVIDVLANPEAASRADVFATPTLIKKVDGTERRLVGDFSSMEKLEIGLLMTPTA